MFAKGFYLFCALSPRLHIHPCAFVKVDNQNFQDFGISTGKHRACSYYKSQTTCGGSQDPKIDTFPILKGQSLNQQRAETLMTVTGWIRGSFVSTYNALLLDDKLITCVFVQKKEIPKKGHNYKKFLKKK